MAKYKITATAMVTLEKEIEASSEREAEDIFYSDTYEDIMDDVDNSDITDINTDSVELVEANYKVLVTNIQYSKDEDEDTSELPKQLTFWVTSSHNPDTDDIYFEEDVEDAIEDRVDFIVEDFSYKVLGSE